eukprot:CAMPEP_0174699714 /NCGR_PEP_ID=MMETSP1094-20130205/4910_1 /TAXON_ID=156173 /ORGANISM="Chrysochromulina brevifilum, Strain UTEX LB 985" /LENGTH=47 /DNA_ID= /DNA_START= /DNA_END= /DNA_ORIENTATION=
MQHGKGTAEDKRCPKRRVEVGGLREQGDVDRVDPCQLRQLKEAADTG